MGTRASQRALDDAGLKPSDLDLLVLSTFTSDYRVPSSAALVQANLGATCKFFQIDAACSGFVDVVITASALLEYMDLETALLVSTDAHSQYFAPDDFMGLGVFGDGAGAAILRRQPVSIYGIRAHYTGADGSKGMLTWVPGGGTKEPISEKVLAEKRHYGTWAHREIYPLAVEKMVYSTQVAAERAGWDLDDVDLFIPHQAGRNIILDAAHRLEQPEDKFVIVIEETGNTSGASIPIALDMANRAGRLKDGAKIITPAIGAGLAWGALALVWKDNRPLGNTGRPGKGNGASSSDTAGL